MFRIVRAQAKIVFFAILIAVGVVTLLLRRPRTRAARAEWLHGFCASTLRRMGISLRYRGPLPTTGAIISNHMGYLDIMAFSALGRCVFVSKSEIASWPVIGWMTTQAGTVYVQRGQGGSADRAKSALRSTADEGVPIVFFPEGTSTNGAELLPFRSGLLADCIEAGLPITPAIIRYRLTQPNPPGSANLLPYWDDTPIAVHIFRILALRGIEIEITFAEAPVVFSPAALADRHIAAAEAHTAVLSLRGANDVISELTR